MKNLKMKVSYIIFFMIVTLLFTSCANTVQIDECIVNDPYGFWSGLWHGFISPLAFIGSLLSDEIALYAVNNNGSWYDFGYVLGAGILFGSSR